MHNIEREMEFKGNKLFVVHDSEGFEAGQEDEFQNVANFIRSRGGMQSINDRLHAIWYCLTTNSRPIQRSEEIFFSVKHEVPVVAIFTKFDLLVEEQLQDLMAGAEDPDNMDEELERQAAEAATEKFEKHYKSVLLKKPFPPQAVVAVSNIHTSTPKDSRFRELLNATSKAIDARLSSLCASAQMADLQIKYRVSVEFGLPSNAASPDSIVYVPAYINLSSLRRQRRLISVWNMVRRENVEPILSTFKSYVENHPQTLYNESPLKLIPEIMSSNPEQALRRSAQLVADLTVIMAEIFFLQPQHKSEVGKIVEEFPNTPAFHFIRKSVLEVDWELLGTKKSFQFLSSVGIQEIVRIITEAIALNAQAAPR